MLFQSIKHYLCANEHPFLELRIIIIDIKLLSRGNDMLIVTNAYLTNI